MKLEYQRESIVNAWKNSKIFLKPVVEKDDEKATITVEYFGEKYSESFYKKDCYGKADHYNIAYNMLLRKMKNINNKIEIEYTIN